MRDLIYIIFFAVIYLVIISITAGFTTVLERRVAGRIQSRIGPNRVGPQGMLQWVADGLKAIQKEDIIPKDVNPLLFKAAPYLVFMGVFGALVPIPLGMFTYMADLNVGIFYVIASSSFVVIGIVMAGWSSNNKWSLIGGIRSAAQLISFEIPLAISIFVIVILTGSLNFQDIIRSQGPNPWDWYLFRNPFTFIAFIIYFIAALAEGNRVPFDIPEAESELVSGYNTEYSGMRFLFFFFAEWANMVVTAAIVVSLFLGGWNFWWTYQIAIDLPGLSHEGRFEILGVIWYILKIIVVVFFIIQVRWTLPRLRVDQLMDVSWKYLIPIGLLSSLCMIVWIYFFPDGSVVDFRARIVMSSFGLLLFIFFCYRVFYNLYKSKSKIHLNPFL